MNALKPYEAEEREREADNANETAIQVYSACLPDPVRRERMKQSLAQLPHYCWALAKERDDAMEALEAAKDAHELGFRNQVKHHLMRAEDKFLFDASNKAVVLARRAGFDLKPLAKLSREPGRQFEIRGIPVRGQDVRWRFTGVEDFDHPVPARILKDARALRGVGFEWHNSYIGEPFVVQVRRIASDPILAVALGRWLLEVGRW